MANLKQKIDAERRGRQMLDDGGLPPPDHVEYGYTCVRFFWLDSKSVLVIDIDDPAAGIDDPAAAGWSSEGADVAATFDDGDEP